MNYPPVRTKKDFVRRYMAGEFGNRPPTWNDLKTFLTYAKSAGNDWVGGLYHLRNRIASADTWFNLSAVEVEPMWNIALSMGYNPDDLYISQMAPTGNTLVQGELQIRDKGLELHGTYVKLPMRDALKESSFNMVGLQVTTMLKLYCDANSVEWINVLLELYPGHVIEFSCYNKSFGTVPRSNTVIWEVRNY